MRLYTFFFVFRGLSAYISGIAGSGLSCGPGIAPHTERDTTRQATRPTHTHVSRSTRYTDKPHINTHTHTHPISDSTHLAILMLFAILSWIFMLAGVLVGIIWLNMYRMSGTLPVVADSAYMRFYNAYFGTHTQQLDAVRSIALLFVTISILLGFTYVTINVPVSTTAGVRSNSTEANNFTA